MTRPVTNTPPHTGLASQDAQPAPAEAPAPGAAASPPASALPAAGAPGAADDRVDDTLRRRDQANLIVYYIAWAFMTVGVVLKGKLGALLMVVGAGVGIAYFVRHKLRRAPPTQSGKKP